MIAYILNLIDLFCTLYAISHGAVELNPLMQNPVVMILYKTIVVGFLLYWLGKRTEPMAVLGFKFVVVLYVIIDVYHAAYILYAGR
nr:MAG TPA: hypothetical protein [Caudoviricetes sp.]